MSPLQTVTLWLSSLAPQDCNFTAERLLKNYSEAVSAVEQAMGASIADKIHVRLSNEEEVAKLLAEENRPIFESQLHEVTEAKAQAQSFGEAMSKYLFAKYSWFTQEVLVLPGNLLEMSELLDIPELCSDETLRAVLVHELVHAVDDTRFEFESMFAKLSAPGHIEAANAVIEGHAQHVARRICKDRGWSKGFDVFTAAISALPKSSADEGVAVQLLQQLVVVTITASYVQGEQFIAALDHAGGEAAVERAFRDTPKSAELIHHPEWYLHPEQQPKLTFDLEAALDAFDALHSEEWARERATMTPPQLSVSIALLPPEVVQRIQASIVGNRILALTPEAAPGSRQITLALFEGRSPTDAAFFVDANEQLMRSKDEAMREGTIRILDAEYKPFERGEARGFSVHKTVEVHSVRCDVREVVVSLGKLAVEINYSVEPIEEETLVRIALDVLQGVRESLKITFEDGAPGQAPAGSSAIWKVVEDAEAQSGSHVLKVMTENSGSTFNVWMSDQPHPADLTLEVKLRADTGVEDMGGGLLWRARDADNYYVTRWNPLEKNLRLYKVEAGVRTMLQSAETQAAAAGWHELSVTMQGATMRVSLDDAELLSINDLTFTEPGNVGLWTKADACTSFDDLVIRGQ